MEQFALGLVWGLAQLPPADEEYVIVCPGEFEERIARYLTPSMRAVTLPDPHVTEQSGRENVRFRLRKAVRYAGPWIPPRLAAGLHPWFDRDRILAELLASLRPDVVHFTTQHLLPVAAPTVFEPHDLQHVHFPEFFTREQLVYRRGWYPQYCRRATVVMASSRWIKNDLIEQFHMPADRVRVVWTGSTVEMCDESAATPPGDLASRYRLLLPFCLYPAQTWPHKNHIRLLQALAELRSAGLDVNLVCTGRREVSYWPVIERCVADLGLADHVAFLDFVPEEDLVGLYRAARCVIIPTLHESSSLPMLEAFHLGVPVVSSTATALPEQGGEAALYFDPYSPGDIARALGTVWTDEELRERLRDRGRLRSKLFSWLHAARVYRAVYRSLAGGPLDADDRSFLAGSL